VTVSGAPGDVRIPATAEVVRRVPAASPVDRYPETKPVLMMR
jgi:hypothetical protein